MGLLCQCSPSPQISPKITGQVLGSLESKILCHWESPLQQIQSDSVGGWQLQRNKKRLTWGKGGKKKHRLTQRTWLVLVPALTRWRWRAQQRGCAWTGRLRQLKHAKRTATESLTNQLRFSFSQDNASAVSVHSRLSMDLQLGQGHTALQSLTLPF